MVSNRQKDRIAGCHGKTKFLTYTRAKRTASHQAHKRGEAFTPYACSHCGSFHVGTTIAGGSPSGKEFDLRQRYRVFARGPDGIEQAVGFSNHADGSNLGKALGAGWTITRTVPTRK